MDWQKIHWRRLDLEMIVVNAGKSAPSPLLALEAAFKAIGTQLGASVGESERGPQWFFHIEGKGHSSRWRENLPLTVRVLFPRADADFCRRWSEVCGEYFRAVEHSRTVGLLRTGEVQTRSIEDLAQEIPEPADPKELCLEFLTPVPFTPAKGRARTWLGRDAFTQLFVGRLKRFFGNQVGYHPDDDDFGVLPYFWHYFESRRQARSQPGHTQYIKGCLGKVYLKGRMRQFWPFLLAGSELHAGAKRSNAQGYFQLNTQPVPFFSSFPSTAELQGTIDRVIERYDDAQLELAESEGEPFSPPEVAERLASELNSGSYRPAPTEAMEVKKADGGTRIIERMPMRDLVVHEYLLQLLNPVLDAMFEPGSVGYRRGYSRQTAAEMIDRAISEGCRYVLKADIEDFFPSVSLERLGALLTQALPTADQRVVETVQRLLHAGRLLSGRLEPRLMGLAQGAPLSPILANLYLDSFDELMEREGVRMIRYADDFVLLGPSLSDLEALLVEAGKALQAIGLRLSAEKTQIIPVQEGFTFLGLHFPQSAQGGEVVPHLLKKPLYVTEPYLFLSVNGDAIRMSNRGKTVDTFPLRRLNEVIIMGPASFSSGFVQRCAEFGIPVTLTLSNGYHVATIKPDDPRYYQVAFLHAARYGSLPEVEKLALGKEIAANKLLRYIPVLEDRYQPGTAAFVRGIREAVSDIESAVSLDAVRGYEGLMTRRIYRELGERIQVPEFRFRKRERSKPDRINSLMNLGSYLIFSRINAGLRGAGLNPYLGFLHSPENRYESLVCDVQELFRAYVDRLNLRLINLRVISAKDFDETPRGCYLRHDGLGRYLERSQELLAQRPGKGELSLLDHITVQIETFRRWAVDDHELGFFRGAE